MTCPECGVFYEQGSNSPNHVEGCSNQEQPYAHQPSPVHSEMSGQAMPARNIPAPGMEQTGGNPDREGILGGQDGSEGWKPAMYRDESFASVSHRLEASDDEFPFYIEQVVEPGLHTREVDAPGQPIILQHDDPSVLDDAAAKLGKTAGFFSDLASGVGNVASGAWNGAKGALGDAANVAGDIATNPIVDDAALGLGEAGLAIGTGGAAIPEEVAADSALAGGAAAGGSGLLGGLGGLAGKVKGAISGGMSNLPGTVMKGMGFKAGENALQDMTGMGGGGGGGGGSDPNNYGVGMELAPTQQSTQMLSGLQRLHEIVGADYESPNSIPKREDTDDPENVDPHEVNDGDHQDWQKQPDVNGIGGTTEGTQTGHDPETSHALGHFTVMLPLLKHFHDKGDGSGMQDPMVQLLDQLLEAEVPGYKDHGEDGGAPNIFKMLFDDAGSKDEAGDHDGDSDIDGNDTDSESGGDSADKTTDKGSELPGTDSSEPSSGGSVCKHCGEAGELGLGICPHCGRDQGEGREGQTPHHDKPGQPVARVAGISDVQQLQAVWEKLKGEGRENELPKLVENPDSYTPELIEIQGQQQIPTDQESTPPPPPPGPPGGQENTPPGAGMPMPAPPTGIQPMGGLGQVQCPKCNSHTTEILNSEDGYSACKTCGHKWDAQLEPHDGQSDHMNHSAAGFGQTEGESMDSGAQANPTTLSDADQHQQHDHTKQQDSSLSWIDAQGQPLQVGTEYLIKSPKYSVPMRGTITAVKPHAIEYTQTGELGLDRAIEVSKQEADMDGIEFVPSDPGDQELGNPGMEQNNDYAGEADPGYQTDLADSSDYRNLASIQDDDPRVAAYHAEHQGISWLMSDDDTPGQKTAGAQYSPREQDALIREQGTARNLDRLALKGTHYSPEWGVEEDEGWLW